MNELESHCKKHLNKLDKLIDDCENYLKQTPEGSLRISCQKNIPRYYWKCDLTNIQGKYIRRKNIDLAEHLAQKDYVEKLLYTTLKQKKFLLEFMDQYNWNKIALLHKELSPIRQSLITPLILSGDEYAIKWEKICLEKMNRIQISMPSYRHYPIDEESGFLTEKGDLVRSKSEKIIADKLYKLNIPYIYEMPLILSRNIVLHPDFTVLNKRTKKEYYWEHLGLMDNNDYSEQAVKKINTYEQNHIYQGKQLLMTYETKNQPLNIKRLERTIQEFLI